jgi:hypothetical protein
MASTNVGTGQPSGSEGSSGQVIYLLTVRRVDNRTPATAANGIQKSARFKPMAQAVLVFSTVATLLPTAGFSSSELDKVVDCQTTHDEGNEAHQHLLRQYPAEPTRERRCESAADNEAHNHTPVCCKVERHNKRD